MKSSSFLILTLLALCSAFSIIRPKSNAVLATESITTVAWKSNRRSFYSSETLDIYLSQIVESTTNDSVATAVPIVMLLATNVSSSSFISSVQVTVPSTLKPDTYYAISLVENEGKTVLASTIHLVVVADTLNRNDLLSLQSVKDTSQQSFHVSLQATSQQQQALDANVPEEYGLTLTSAQVAIISMGITAGSSVVLLLIVGVKALAQRYGNESTAETTSDIEQIAYSITESSQQMRTTGQCRSGGQVAENAFPLNDTQDHLIHDTISFSSTQVLLTDRQSQSPSPFLLAGRRSQSPSSFMLSERRSSDAYFIHNGLPIPPCQMYDKQYPIPSKASKASSVV